MDSTTTNLMVVLATGFCVPIERVDDYKSYKGRMGLRMLIKGLPGIGKSERLVQLGNKLEIPTHLFPTESIQVEDLDGVMVSDGAGGVRRATDNPDIPKMRIQGEGLIIFDEINVSQKLDAAIRRVILDSTHAREKLPHGVRVVASANPPEISMSGRPLSAPLANAMCHLQVSSPSFKGWAKYMAGYDDELDEVEPLVRMRNRIIANWSRVYEENWMKMLHFTGAKADAIHKVPENRALQQGSWPSPRTWTMAWNTIATCRALDAPRDVEEALVSGCIGSVAAEELYEFWKSSDLPTVQEVLDKGWHPDPRRSDRTYAVHMSLADYVLKNTQKDKVTPETVRIAYGAWRQCEITCKTPSSADMALPVVQALLRRGLGALLSSRSSSFPTQRKQFEEITRIAAACIQFFPAKQVEALLKEGNGR